MRRLRTRSTGDWLGRIGLLLGALPASAAALEIGPPIDLGVAVDGEVSAVAPLPSGRIAIVGSFGSVRGLRRAGIALLEPDGAGVPEFAPDCRGPASATAPPACAISRIVAAPGESLIVTGAFAAFGPVARERIAKLDARTGAADPVWNPFAWIAPAPIVDIGVSGDRVVLVLGGATPRIAVVSLAGPGLPVAGTSAIPLPGRVPTLALPEHVYFASGPTHEERAQRVRLDTGVVDPDWRSREFQQVEAMVWDPASASLFVAGAEPFAGSSIGRLLLRIGGAPGAAESPGWNPFQFTIARFRSLQLAGPWLLADTCSTGFIECAIRRLPLAGSGQFDPGYSGNVLFGHLQLLAVDAQARAFLKIANFGPPSPAPDGSRVVRLTDTGVVDPTFRPRVRADTGISRLAPSASGDVVLSGGFQWVDDLVADRFLRLRGDTDRLADWRPFGPTCEPSVCESTTAIAADARNHVFIATKLFDDSSIVSAPALRRYAPEGAPAESWHPDRLIGTLASDAARIDALVVDDADGWLYIGGRFEGDVCGQPRRNLARVTLAAPCRADPTWQPDPDGTIESLALDPQGRLIVAGDFRQIAGQTLASLARFDGDALDTTWRPLTAPPGTRSIPRLAVTSAFVFAEVREALPGANPGVGLLRFDAGAQPGAVPWAPPPAAFIDALVAGPGERLLAVRRGVVPTPFATPVDRIEVFNAGGGGTPVSTLAMAPGQRILDAARRADGSILVAGRFDRIGNAERNAIATLHLDPFALFASSFE